MPRPSHPLPNFFLAGAPKAGTTALYHYLDQHPQVYMSPIKEPCYFASEIRPKDFSEEMRPRILRDQKLLREYLSRPVLGKRFSGLVTEWDDYLTLFRDVTDELAIGEASVCYLWSESAPRNIAAVIPGARIVIILRNPADRAFSQYLHAVTEGLAGASFREYIASGLRQTSNQFGQNWPCLEFGQYSRQIRRYFDGFPWENICIYFYEQLRRDPAALFRALLRFLGVGENFQPGEFEPRLEPRVPRWIAAGNLLKRYGLWQRARDLAPPALRRRLRGFLFRPRQSLVMDARDRAWLIDYYRDDIDELARLLRVDLSHWLK